MYYARAILYLLYYFLHKLYEFIRKFIMKFSSLCDLLKGTRLFIIYNVHVVRGLVIENLYKEYIY